MSRPASDEEKLSVLQKFAGFIFDLDGTVWYGNNLIPGAAEVLELLRQQGKKIWFVTNNSSKTRATYVKKLTQLGVTAHLDEVLGSSFAAALYCSSIKVKKVYVIGEQGLVDELHAMGITTLGGPSDSGKNWEWGIAAQGVAGANSETKPSSTTEGPPKLALDPEVKAVVVGLDRSINYYKLQMAMSYILKNDAHFIATNTDARGNLANEEEWAGAGTMVRAVQGCSEKTPVVVGKPNRLMSDIIAKSAGIPTSSLCMVGDRLDTDILWAEKCGMGSLLVLTGCTSEAQLQSPENTVKPSLYVTSIADLLSVKDKLSWSSCTIC
ncbi:HAD-like domain-containing protein [Dunaliella salina]|uniref:Phosphoglycolate phosphatase n=1 Tax=Dunaliella salina TaxID=3046 RepID=A0ABQ7GXN5_DUNSA|nr:HAD-like domain-containing protein [Dunaliella salina]|eukprot:KAF5839372.1 HAD-like domain-containing protein [Dunaliella salina]